MNRGSHSGGAFCRSSQRQRRMRGSRGLVQVWDNSCAGSHSFGSLFQRIVEFNLDTPVLISAWPSSWKNSQNCQSHRRKRVSRIRLFALSSPAMVHLSFRLARVSIVSLRTLPLATRTNGKMGLSELTGVPLHKLTGG